VAGQGLVAPATGEQTGEEEQLGEVELEVLPVGVMCHHLPALESWKTQWSWRGVLLVLPEVGWATMLRVGLLEAQDVSCCLTHLDRSFLGLWQDSEERSQGSWEPQRRAWRGVEWEGKLQAGRQVGALAVEQELIGELEPPVARVPAALEAQLVLKEQPVLEVQVALEVQAGMN